MKVLSCLLLCIPLIQTKPINRSILNLKDNCEIKKPLVSINYNLSCTSCELGVSIINYENQLNNTNQTLNIMKEVCNSTFMQQYQNLSQECNTIYHNVPTILKQLSINLTANQICSKMYLC